MKIKFYQLTAVGDRETNQDCMANHITEDFALFVVADGLGGHQAGEKASRFFCQGLLNQAAAYTSRIKSSPGKVFENWIDAAIDEMNLAFAGDAVANRAYTTCAILYIEDELVVTAHCGDSRIYRLNENRLLWRTRDHSVLQQLLDDGQISEEQMGTHPDQNKLTRSISVLKNHKPEINLYSPMQQGDTFVLCSDGFWEHTKQHELIHLAQTSIEKIDVAKQIKLAYLRAQGQSDNITVQWVRVL
jgi:PPM family protein phosphatase